MFAVNMFCKAINIMKNLQNLFANPRLIISSISVAVIAMSFWLGSRYPSLGSKEAAGGNIEMDSALGFHALLSFGSADNIFIQILVNAINWMDNNKRGMIFGILFAAAILTFISLWKQRRAKGRLGGMLLGFGIGAPLGVCVNCATPVSQGMHKSGMRLETTLTALFSSPTFNVIVLSILFSLYPFYLAILKVGFTCLFIFLLLPIIIRWTEKFIDDKDVDIDKVVDPSDELACQLEPKIHYTWLESIQWFCVNYLKNLWFVIKVSVPWMIFSGFLGAAIITLVPWSEFTGWLNGLNQWQHFVGLLVTSAFGLLLPSPIAFDVILPSSLLDQGLLPAYTGTLLFSLGIFSIYPFIIVGRYISWQLSITLAISLIVLSMGMGVASGYLGKLHHIKNQELLLSITNAKQNPLAAKEGVTGLDFSAVENFIPNKTEYFPWPGSTPEGIQMKYSSHKTVTAFSKQGFQLRKNEEVGFSNKMPGDPASAYQFFFPTAYSRGLASGDIQNDGWKDVIRATDNGLEVYLNNGEGNFYLLDLGIPSLKNMHVLTVATVDMNNDLYTDLVFTTLSHGNYILYNDKGRLDGSRLIKLPNQKAAVYTVAIAFADFDQDGQTEIVLGNHWLDSKFANEHASEALGKVEYEMDRAKNVILRLNDGQWEVQLLPGQPGATLTLLTTDFDNDGDIDLLVGNDFVWPNTVYTNEGKGEFKVVKNSDQVIPISTRSTMSIDSADFDNDLDLDQFWAQVTTTGEFVYSGEGLRVKDKVQLCEIYADSTWFDECQSMMIVNKHAAQRRIVAACKGIESEVNYKKCVASVLFWASIRTEDRDQCLSLLPSSMKSSDYICNVKGERDIFHRRQVRKKNDTLKILKAKQFTNVLLESKDGTLEHNEETRGLSLTGWSWNALFADFDNDEWQDVYVVNGFFPRKARESNYFMRNDQGKNFVDETVSMGLESYFATGSSVHADFDNDGDIDIVTSPFFAPLKYFQNNTGDNHSLSFELVDLIGNSAGLGSKLVIHYDNGSKKQLREIKASGGYQSFSPPVAIFGLGQHKTIDAVEVFWSTGETTRIDGPIETESKYRIYRFDD